MNEWMNEWVRENRSHLVGFQKLRDEMEPLVKSMDLNSYFL